MKASEKMFYTLYGIVVPFGWLVYLKWMILFVAVKAAREAAATKYVCCRHCYTIRNNSDSEPLNEQKNRDRTKRILKWNGK